MHEAVRAMKRPHSSGDGSVSEKADGTCWYFGHKGLCIADQPHQPPPPPNVQISANRGVIKHPDNAMLDLVGVKKLCNTITPFITGGADAEVGVLAAAIATGT